MTQSYLNVLLVLVPLALVADRVHLAQDAVLIMNYLAIIPLSGLVQQACESISVGLNDLLSKLFVGLSDNLVELVVGYS